MLNVDHYDLLAWVFWLCVLICILLGFDIILHLLQWLREGRWYELPQKKVDNQWLFSGSRSGFYCLMSLTGLSFIAKLWDFVVTGLEQRTYEWHRKGSSPCPIEGCNYHWVSQDGLFTHLAQEHLKSEIIDALIKALILVNVTKRGWIHGRKFWLWYEQGRRSLESYEASDRSLPRS